MKSYRSSLFRAMASYLSFIILILFMAVPPAGAGCCQFRDSCSDSIKRRECTDRGGRWRGGCYICSEGNCVLGIRFLGIILPASLDTTAPRCEMTGARTGPPAQIDVTVQDSESGLDVITAIEERNLSVLSPTFEAGTTDPIVVTATKIDQETYSRLSLAVSDVAENCTICDPILTDVVRGRGREGKEQSFANVDAVDHVVTVSNGNPGLNGLEVEVNGTRFRLSRLEDGETRTLDVSSAMLPGNINTITLRGYGKLGSEAGVTIWDGNRAQ